MKSLHMTPLLFLVAFSSEAFEFKVGPKNSLELIGPNCKDLAEAEKDMCSWKKTTSPSFKGQPNSVCTNVSKGKFKITISDCLPEFALSYHQKKLVNEGANCWGTAMSFKGLSATPRFMWPEEMLYWKESPLCRKLNVNEALLPGDIINVYGPEKLYPNDLTVTDPGIKLWDILYPKRNTKVALDKLPGYSGYHRFLHSVTYVSPQIAFGKDSPSHLDPFYFHPLEEVYARPRKDELECQENQGLSPYLREYQNPPKPIKGSKCSYFSEAMRCENLIEYFKGLTLSEENQKILKNVETLQTLQKKLFPLNLTSKTRMTKDELRSLSLLAKSTVEKTTIQLTEYNAHDTPQNSLHDETKKHLLVLEYFSAAGILKTLEQSKLVIP